MGIFYTEDHQIISNFIITNLQTWSKYCKNNSLDLEYLLNHRIVVSFFYVIIELSYSYQNKNDITLNQYIEMVFDLKHHESHIWSDVVPVDKDYIVLKKSINRFIESNDPNNIDIRVAAWCEEIIKELKRTTVLGKGKVAKFLFPPINLDDDMSFGLSDKISLNVLTDIFSYIKENPYSTI